MNENRKIKLRALEPEDIDLLYEWENNTENWAVSNTMAPFSRHILQKYLDNAHLDIYQTRQLRLMIDIEEHEEATVTAGAIDIFEFEPFHQRAGVGVLIADKAMRGQGLGRAALQELIRYAFETLQLHQLYCNIAISNTASTKLFTSVGFKLVGVKKQWLKTLEGFEDEQLFQLLKDC